MPKLYKNEYYGKSGWQFYSLESKPIYALMMTDLGELVHSYDNQEGWISLGGTSNTDKNLHFVRSELIDSYYYIHYDGSEYRSFYINGNFIYRSRNNDTIEQMHWISNQAPLTYEMEEMILKVMGQGACKRHEIVELIYWHLRALNRLRLGDDGR